MEGSHPHDLIDRINAGEMEVPDVSMAWFSCVAEFSVSFYSAAAYLAVLSAVLAIVNPSVRPSVTVWHCVKTTQAKICLLYTSPSPRD